MVGALVEAGDYLSWTFYKVGWADVVMFPIDWLGWRCCVPHRLHGVFGVVGVWVGGWGGWGAVRRSRENFLIFANFLGFYVLNRLVTREETPSPSLLY